MLSGIAKNEVKRGRGKENEHVDVLCSVFLLVILDRIKAQTRMLVANTSPQTLLTRVLAISAIEPDRPSCH
jgi:hypothetical protein